ncbi:MAG: hypothetical protein ACKVX7_08690 [Planctomycetota bacterium]
MSDAVDIPDSNADALVGSLDKSALLAAVLAADGRERRALFQQLAPSLDAADMERIAPLLRDTSPKLSARITALLARHRCDELFAVQLASFKPGRQAALRAQYQRIRARDAET